MDWVFFGDDWGAHPSTTQHIALNLPPEDRLVWINSIGMRSPSMTFKDSKRALGKLRGYIDSRGTDVEDETALYLPELADFYIVHPKVVPFHNNTFITKLNRLSLKKSIMNAIDSWGDQAVTLLTTNPVAVNYLNLIPQARIAYLRLDDYAKLPGVDPRLVEDTEPKLYECADRVFITAKSLHPGTQYDEKTVYLPQGVNVEQFSTVDLMPSKEKVLGFFGLLAEWVDFDLIYDVATALPDWQLEFIGKVDYLPERVQSLSNVKILPPVAFTALAQSIQHWRAAWIPFKVNDLTEAVNPLKLREYLAAGLPTLSTPMPEAFALKDLIEISASADEVVTWLQTVVVNDSKEQRSGRRESVKNDSWKGRAATLRYEMLRVDPLPSVVSGA